MRLAALAATMLLVACGNAERAPNAIAGEEAGVSPDSAPGGGPLGSVADSSAVESSQGKSDGSMAASTDGANSSSGGGARMDAANTASPSDATSPDASAVTDGPTTADAGSLSPVCSGRKVIFRDDFDGTTLDRTKWNMGPYDFGDCFEPSNGEQECYTDSQVQVHDGLLHLVAIKQTTVGPGTPSGGQPYASGMISSGQNPNNPLKFDFQYGYFEARVKVPAGQGFWPAFWTNNTDQSWPPEIDVLEILGNDPAKWYGTYHWIDGSNMNQSDGTAWTGPDFSRDFHTFGVDWEPDHLVWYIDGTARKSITNASIIQSKRLFLVANLAVGGSWPGNPDNTTPFPSEFDIDYVYVCQ